MKQSPSFVPAAKLFTPFIKSAPIAATIIAAGLMAACSSSDSGPADASISGAIIAAPVSGADVSVVDLDDALVAETEPTDADGLYKDLVIPGGSLAKDLIIKSTGGAFIDEATGNDGVGGEMLAYIPANTLTNGDSVSVTPGSTIVAHLVLNHGKSLADAETAFLRGFAYTPDVSVTPIDATVAAVGASDESKLGGLRAAAFSQLAMDLGLSQNDQFIMFVAFAKDLSDGKLDGLMDTEAVEIDSPTVGKITLPADILMRSANAMLAFQKSGNSEMDLTSSYRIEYTSAMAMAGRSEFTFEITNTDGSPAVGVNPEVKPLMYMIGGFAHTTPLTDVTDNGDGTYTTTLYYLMPSMMMMEGIAMGYWDLAVTVDNETVHFYPNVMMSMGDTPLVRLLGVEDTVTNMEGLTVGRPYTIFKESLMEMGGLGKYDFSVFIVGMETMMSFPAVYDGSTLSDETLDVIVEISDDDGLTWKSANGSTNDGFWTVNGLTLTDGVEDEIRVRLQVGNSVYMTEYKTTDGKPRVEDDNDYHTFTVTPGGMVMMP